MSFRPRHSLSIVGVASSMLVAGACSQNDGRAASRASPPTVTAARVINREVRDSYEFNGHFEAVNRVELRPRVSGYITSVNFTEGREVEKDAVLFVVDRRPYRAELNRTEAELARSRTQLALAISEKARALKLADVHAISRETLETLIAAEDQARSNLRVAEAAQSIAALNFEFTEVRAPIAGIAGRARVTAGNLVTSGDTLTTVLSVDPIYVTFEGDESIYLSQLTPASGAGGPRSHPVWIGLNNESGHPHAGEVVFVDNEINAATSTVHIRGLVNNPGRLFAPGMFARIQVSANSSHRAVLISETAIGTDQNLKYVLVVNDGKAEYRRVTLGQLIDGLREIRSGLGPDDSVVVNGLQRTLPGAPITVQSVAMENAVNIASSAP